MPKIQSRKMYAECIINEILELLSYSTEISPKLFHRCDNHSYDMYMKNIRYVLRAPCTYVGENGDRCENIKALTMVGKGKYKSIRLTESAYSMGLMKMVNPIVAKRYQMNGNVKFGNSINPHMIERNHRLSELCLDLKQNAIVDYWIDEAATTQTNAFINLRMIKSLYPSEATHQGRGYGLLLLGGKCYAVYIFDKPNAYWTRQTELRNKALVQRAIFDKINHLVKEGADYFDQAIIFGSDLKMARILLDKKDNASQPDNRLRLDDTFQNFHYIPNAYRHEMLDLLKTRQLLDQLKKMTFGEKVTISKTVDCDGVTAEHQYLMFAFDLNLTRIWRFKKNAAYYSNKQFILYGFEWQKTFLESYCGERIKVLSISYENLKKNFK